MSAHLNGFNRVARFYDLAKRVVFGKAVFESKAHFIKTATSGGKILIIGGGSGETLPLLLQRNPQCHIWFLDASSEMLEIARGRIQAKSKGRITFLHSTKDRLPEGIVFDMVITDFILDLFSDDEVARIAQRVAKQLHTQGAWLATDFVDAGRRWQKIMLWCMYRFFRLTCDIEATRLPSWQLHIRSAGMAEVSAKTFYGGFIRSAVYGKRPADLALSPEQIILRS